MEEERRLIATLITKKPPGDGTIMTLLMILVMVVTSVFFWQGPTEITSLLPAVQDKVIQQQQWWRIFTAMFVHGDLQHLLSNMYMLSFFSYFIFAYFGWRAFPLPAIVAAAVVNLLAILTYPPQVNLIGASGLVYLLGGFWLTMYFFIQRQYGYINRTLRVLGIGIMIFFPTTFEPTTSYRTHAIGLVIGVALAALVFYKNKLAIRAHEKYKVSYVEPEPTFH